MMRSFAEEIDGLNWEKLAGLLEEVDRRDVERVLGKVDVDEQDLPILFSSAAQDYLEPMAQRSAEMTRLRFGATMQLYGPLYLSNACVNRCAYCGFSLARSAERRTLSMQELVDESRALRAMGMSHVLLVSGESPSAMPVERLAAYATRIRSDFSSVSMEVGAQDLGGYRQLVQAGVDGLTLYQETYDKECYRRVHLGGPKANYERRLGAIEHAGEAGFRSIGIGSLLGLSDARVEGYLLARHGRYLQKRFWRSRLSVSFPRIRDFGGSGAFQVQPVSDRLLVQLICAMRLAIPDAELVLSTREPSMLRDRLMGLGITRVSAESRTVPGGYAQEKQQDAEQFAIQDKRTVAEVVNAIEASGKEAVYKDFDRALVQAADAIA